MRKVHVFARTVDEEVQAVCGAVVERSGPHWVMKDSWPREDSRRFHLATCLHCLGWIKTVNLRRAGTLLREATSASELYDSVKYRRTRSRRKKEREEAK